MDHKLLQGQRAPARTIIDMVIMDGLGGLPLRAGGRTELETARTPNLDALAARSALGLTIPVAPGITPGSGPGHLAIFGYDPVGYQIGRGALEALGIGIDLRPGDVAARGNLCSVDDAGRLTDRRAGRLPTAASQELCQLLRRIAIPGVEFLIEAVKEHRFALVMRGPGLSAALTATDPPGHRAAPRPCARAVPRPRSRRVWPTNLWKRRAGSWRAPGRPTWCCCAGSQDIRSYRHTPSCLASMPQPLR